MTEEEQRMAIAEFDGWREAFPRGKDPHPETKRGGILLPYHWVNERTHARMMDLPDYLHDLNAMREAWSHLDEEAKIRFIHELYTVCGFDICVFGHDDTRQASEVSNATAAQRAEALLRTIGKWVDSPAKSACQPGT